MFLHLPKQHCHVNGHLILHSPQWLTSEVTSTHRFWQHRIRKGSLSPRLHIHGRPRQPPARGSPGSLPLHHFDTVNEALVVAILCADRAPLLFVKLASPPWRTRASRTDSATHNVMVIRTLSSRIINYRKTTTTSSRPVIVFISLRGKLNGYAQSYLITGGEAERCSRFP